MVDRRRMMMGTAGMTVRECEIHGFAIADRIVGGHLKRQPGCEHPIPLSHLQRQLVHLALWKAELGRHCLAGVFAARAGSQKLAQA